MTFGGYDPNKQSTSASRTKKFYLKEGSNLYRVLPPAKSLKDQNKIAQYWSVIWIADSSGKLRPVASILKKNRDRVIQRDPLLEKIDEIRQTYDEAVKSGASEEQLKTLRELFKKVYNKKVYALNVVNPAGEVGVLEIPYTSYQNLKQRITELYNQGIDAVGIGEDKGILFDFKKTKDERGRVIYPVDIAQKTSRDSSGNFMVTYIRAPISEAEAEVLSSKVADLTTLYRELSYQDMEALSTLDPKLIDAVFSKGVDLDEEGEEGEGSEEGCTTTSEEEASFNFSTSGLSTKTASQLAKGHTVETTNNTAAVANGGFFSGGVLQNDKAREFLFPDKK